MQNLLRNLLRKNAIPQEKKKVDYIECLDEKGIKVIGWVQKVKFIIKKHITST